MHITGLKPELLSTNQENTQNKVGCFFFQACVADHCPTQTEMVALLYLFIVTVIN